MNELASREEALRDARSALQAVESVLARRQDNEDLAKVSEQFSAAVRSVVHLRNGIAASQCAGAPAPDTIPLERINALISVMASIEYPLAGIHWPRIQQVRDSLKQLLEA